MNSKTIFIRTISKKLREEVIRTLDDLNNSQENKTGLGSVTLIKLTRLAVPAGMIEEERRLIVRMHLKTKGNTLVKLGTNNPKVNSTSDQAT
jgi:hypothetical protein